MGDGLDVSRSMTGFLLFFFFSSRRRHTRLTCDWSSDVCSSDLTVNSGAIDPLREIAAVCREHDVWLHVDGSYGGPAVLTDRYRPELEAIALADSLALDPHRSEERRVGKECRPRRSTDQYRKSRW